MNRKHFLRGALAASAVACALPRGSGGAETRSRPLNILFICTDQERSWVDLPRGLPLPAHERLLREGIGFENYHVNTSPCGPSRSVIYTGRHTQHTGVYVNPNSDVASQLSPLTPTIGTMLRQAGYFTAYKGKWHLTNLNEGKNYRGTPRGPYPNSVEALEPFGFSDYQFDGDKVGLTWDGFKEDGSIAAEAASALRKFAAGRGGSRPWFLAVNFVNPHDIMFFDATGHQEETRASRNWVAPHLEAPADPLYLEDWGFDLPRSFYADDLSGKPEAHAAINALQNGFYGRMDREDVASWKRFQNYYFNCLRDVDRHLARVLQVLDETRLAERTIVLYTSDHGERAGAHGMRQKGGTIYKEDMRVPLIVRHPDVQGGRTTRALASAVDLAPTILSLAGAKAAEMRERHPALRGVDFSAVLDRPATRTLRDERGILFNYAVRYDWGRAENGEMALDRRRLLRGVHDGRFKFARYFAPAQHHLPRDWQTLRRYNDLELYDTASDPDEIENLASDPEAHRGAMLRLNAMTNALIEHEIGRDDGSEYPGPTELYNTLGAGGNVRVKRVAGSS